MKNFDLTFTVAQSPQEVFDGIINVRGWWSSGLEGESELLGDEFIYRHGEIHYSKHRLTEVVPYTKVVWLTLEGSINFVDDKTEWNNTTIVFDITENKGETTLHFTHIGLTPELACYNGCSRGWSYYIDSLKKLITTGTGTPDPIA
ncbi:MAG: SRPBCC family protein [Mucilaginibacter sp.]